MSHPTKEEESYKNSFNIHPRREKYTKDRILGYMQPYQQDCTGWKERVKRTVSEKVEQGKDLAENVKTEASEKAKEYKPHAQNIKDKVKSTAVTTKVFLVDVKDKASEKAAATCKSLKEEYQQRSDSSTPVYSLILEDITAMKEERYQLVADEITDVHRDLAHYLAEEGVIDQKSPLVDLICSEIEPVQMVSDFVGVEIPDAAKTFIPALMNVDPGSSAVVFVSKVAYKQMQQVYCLTP